MERIDGPSPSVYSAPREAASGGRREVDLTPVRTYWQLVRQRFLRHRLAVIALFVLAVLVIARGHRPAAHRQRLSEDEPGAHQQAAVPGRAARLRTTSARTSSSG